MIKIMAMGAMLLILSISGCGSSDEPKSLKSTPETAPGKATESGETSVDKVNESMEAVAEQSKTMGTVVSEEYKGVTLQAAEARTEAVNDVKKEAEQAAETAVLKEKSTVMAAGDADDAVKKEYVPETIVFETSYGNVTLPHAQHAGDLECISCHGDSVPGPFEFDKNQAHDLCKGCHEAKGAGPTACKGCHKK